MKIARFSLSGFTNDAKNTKVNGNIGGQEGSVDTISDGTQFVGTQLAAAMTIHNTVAGCPGK